MSNLGWYQLLTTMAKRVKGPKRLIALLVGGGALLGGGAVIGGNAIKKSISLKIEKKKQEEMAAIVHTVIEKGITNEGLQFEVGDTFKVLEFDGDAALIEKIGIDNNPYFVSRKFLNSISDYKL